MRPLAELQVFHDRELHSAAMNMAIDEALLESITAPALRFYGWRRPSISFGYFGTFAEVAAEEARHEIVRRWTGGGIVFHGEDFTYSLILPRVVESGRAIYAWVHAAIQQALAVTANITLATDDAPKISDACFANPVIADVLANGRKIAGAAQRRTRAGLLHQGSIQFNALPGDFPERFGAALYPNFTRAQFTPALLARADELCAEKYATNEWLRRR